MAGVIRDATSSDLDAILAILAGWPTHFVDRAIPLIKVDFQDHSTLVFAIGERVLGFVIWRAGNHETELLWLAVERTSVKQRVGTTLVSAVIGQVPPTHRRIFLRTATTDSVIPGTRFDGRMYGATNAFFKRFGFADAAIETNYWGPGNHALTMSRPLSPLNPLLATLAPFIRRLQREIGQAFNVAEAYVGMAFPRDQQSAVFFAEYVTPRAEFGSEDAVEYRRDEYVLPRGLTFVSSIVSSPAGAFRYSLESPGSTEIDGDMRLRWGQGTTEASVLCVPLQGSAGHDNAVLYFVTKDELSKGTQVVLAQSASLVSQVLRTALFLGARRSSHERRVRELAEELAGRLPSFEEYESQFRKVTADLANPTAWFTNQFPADSVPTIHLPPGSERVHTDEALLRAVRNASEITVKGSPEGSFQGRIMRFVTIRPRDLSGVPQAGQYDAVLKEVDYAKAQNEQSGYQHAQFFFKDISFALPPPALLWPVSDSGRGASQRFASVIPRVSGRTLASYLQERWFQFGVATESTADHFCTIMDSLSAFTRGLGQGLAKVVSEVPQACVYESHLGDSPDARRRAPKTFAALSFFLDGLKDHPVLQIATPGGYCEIVNPLWFLTEVRRNSVGPNDDKVWRLIGGVDVAYVDLCHGDFHTGNILVRPDGTVTVLDYDYVARGRQFTDLATLEASVLLSLAGCTAFLDESRWMSVFPALLAGLAEQEGPGKVPRDLLKNTNAFNVWRVIQTLRVPIAEAKAFGSYRALLVSALLRLTASHYSVETDKRRYHPGVMTTALVFTGMLLSKLTRMPNVAEQPPELCLFEQPFDLAGPRLELDRLYCQQYFKAMASLAREPSGANTQALNEQLAELMTVAAAKEPSDAASMLRFGLRLSRADEVDDSHKQGMRARLAALYDSQAAAVEDSVERARLLSWAARYSMVLRPEAGMNVVQAPSAPAVVMQGGDVTTGARAIGAWRVCGVSHAGTFSEGGAVQPENEDALLFVEGANGLVLVAVADGTGDSAAGERASAIALGALATAWRESDDLRTAVGRAAAALQEDNRVQHLDGACTLAVAVLDGQAGQVVQLGDTRVIAVTPTALWSRPIDVSSRVVLGGEPLGRIITSSGNSVGTVGSASEVQIEPVADISRIALVSDGAFVGEDRSDDLAEIGRLLEQSKTPSDAAHAIVNRSLDAFRLGRRKRDNVTAIVGIFSGSS